MAWALPGCENEDKMQNAINETTQQATNQPYKAVSDKKLMC